MNKKAESPGATIFIPTVGVSTGYRPGRDRSWMPAWVKIYFESVRYGYSGGDWRSRGREYAPGHLLLIRSMAEWRWSLVPIRTGHLVIRRSRGLVPMALT